MQDQRTYDLGIFAAEGPAKSVATYIPATIVYRGISFVRGLILAWLLAREAGQFGLLNVVLQVVNILAPLASFGLNEAITRYLPKYQGRGQLVGFLRTSIRLVLAVSVCATVAMLALSPLLGEYVFSNDTFTTAAQAHSLALVTVLTIFVIVLYFLAVAVLKGLRSFAALSVLELTHGILFVAVSVVAVLLISARAETVIWSYLAALALPVLILSVFLARKTLGRTDQCRPLRARKLPWRLLRFGIWGAMAGITWQAWQTYSLWHLTKFDTAAHSDAFAAARVVGQLIIIVGMSLGAIIMTNVYAHWESGSRKHANFLLGLYSKVALTGLLIVAFVVVFARNAIMIVLPEQFGQAAVIMPQVVLFFVLCTGLAFLAIHFALIEKMHLLLWSWGAGLAVNVLLARRWAVGPDAMVGAADAAVWAAVPALVITIILIRAKGQPISAGIISILVAGPVVLLTNGLISSLALAALLAVGLLTPWMFSRREKSFLAERIKRKRE